MAKKKQFFMERINNKEYYTTNQNLYEKRLKQDKWLNIYNNCGIWFVLAFSIFAITLAPQEILNWQNVIAWVFTGIGLAGVIAVIIVAIVASKKIDKYEWEKEFENSKEFARQQAKYKKIEKAKQDKIKTEKATKLVESYEILDSKELSKQEKVDLIKKYIDIKEK